MEIYLHHFVVVSPAIFGCRDADRFKRLVSLSYWLGLVHFLELYRQSYLDGDRLCYGSFLCGHYVSVLLCCADTT